VQYLVKWKGEEDMTWEPLSNLKDCSQALSRFRQQRNSERKQALLAEEAVLRQAQLLSEEAKTLSAREVDKRNALQAFAAARSTRNRLPSSRPAESSTNTNTDTTLPPATAQDEAQHSDPLVVSPSSPASPEQSTSDNPSLPSKRQRDASATVTTPTAETSSTRLQHHKQQQTSKPASKRTKSTPKQKPKSSQPEYIVERVIDKRVQYSLPEYLVKWQGYPITQCTWEPLSNLDGCQDELTAFEASRKADKPAKTRPPDS
jgi:hypothetical protein